MKLQPTDGSGRIRIFHHCFAPSVQLSSKRQEIVISVQRVYVCTTCIQFYAVLKFLMLVRLVCTPATWVQIHSQIRLKPKLQIKQTITNPKAVNTQVFNEEAPLIVTGAVVGLKVGVMVGAFVLLGSGCP